MKPVVVIFDEETGSEIIRERDTEAVQVAAAAILNIRRGMIDVLARLIGLESRAAGAKRGRNRS